MRVTFVPMTVRTVFRPTVLILLLLWTLALAGCSDDNHSSPESATVFAEFSSPSTAEDVELWIAEFPVQVAQLRSHIFSVQTVGWDQELIPLYDLLLSLNNADSYNTLLMDRSPDVEVRTLAYGAYSQFTQLILSLKMDNELKAVVEKALNNLVATTTQQKFAAEYLTSTFSSQYTVDQQRDIMQAEADLTAVSLQYYSNTVSKSAVGLFSPEDFSCLPETFLATIPTDSDGNFIFDANDGSLYMSLAGSCLDEDVREQLHAVYSSKAAAENSLLWPTILEHRLTYAQLQDFDDFAAMRLSRGMLQNVATVTELLDQVKEISDPAFKRYIQRIKDARTADEGGGDDTVFMWDRDRYYWDIAEQVMGRSPADPHLLPYPETFDRMLYLVGKILGLRFEKTGLFENGWNPDVVEYLVYDQDSNAPVGTFFLDPYHVEGGTSVASCQRLMRPRALDSGNSQAPVVVLKSSVIKDTGTTYLTPYEYWAFGHELGHALFFLCSTQQSEWQADFIEIPSTFCEKLVQTPQFLKALLSPNPDVPLIALPPEFENYWNYKRESPVLICANTRFLLSQSATSLDLAAWQGVTTTDLAEVARGNLLKYYFPYSSQSRPFYNVMHFIKPSTDATYYFYVLAQVVSADILRVFEDSAESIFDQQLGAQYRYHLLENTDSDSAAAITTFLGREWNYEAFQDWFEEKTEDL